MRVLSTRTMIFAAAALFGCSELKLPAGSSDAAPSEPPDLSNSYVLDVSFDPATGALDAAGELVIVADGPVERIEFLLNGGLEVETFEPDIAADFEVEDGIMIGDYELPNAKRLTLSLAEPLAEGDRLTIDLSYAGTVTTETIEIGRGVVSPRWTEMTMEALWYPVWLDEPLVRSNVTLAMPEGYELSGPGGVRSLGSGRWELDPGVPVLARITFVASREWATARREVSNGIEATLYTPVPEPRADQILGAVGGAYDEFQTMFGPPTGSGRSFTIVYANEEVGLVYPNQAYASGGNFIVLDDSEAVVQQDTLHHEVAHLWWARGRPGTPDEFLSESLAEYLAMRRGLAVWDDDWLENKRARLAQMSAAIDASLLDIDGFTGPRQPLLYQRGPTVLWALHDRLGDAPMDALLSAAYERDVKTLDGFIDLLADREGAATADWFRNLL